MEFKQKLLHPVSWYNDASEVYPPTICASNSRERFPLGDNFVKTRSTIRILFLLLSWPSGIFKLNRGENTARFRFSSVTASFKKKKEKSDKMLLVKNKN